jgi:hypothetical protein
MRLADLAPIKLLLPAIPLVVIAVAPASPPAIERRSIERRAIPPVHVECAEPVAPAKPVAKLELVTQPTLPVHD